MVDNIHTRPSVSGCCCKPEWESPPTLSILVLSLRAATNSSNRHLSPWVASHRAASFLPLHVCDRGVSCEHFWRDPVLPCFTPSCSSRLIGLAGHLPAFLVLEVKGFRLNVSATSFLHNCSTPQSFSCARNIKDT